MEDEKLTELEFEELIGETVEDMGIDLDEWEEENESRN